MLIGELSSKTGFSRDTIRFYEKSGLIEPGRKSRRTNSYKEYTDEILARLQAIKNLKAFGFTLNEIKSLFKVWESQAFSCEAEKHKVSGRILEIENKINQLMDMKLRLLNSVKNCPENCAIVNSLKEAGA